MASDEYITRIVDKQLELKLRAFGATNIVGPKWCGKTTTAEQYSRSAIKLQKDPNKEARFLKEKAICSNETEIVAIVDGKIVGTAGIEAVGKKYKTEYRTTTYRRGQKIPAVFICFYSQGTGTPATSK